MLRIDVVKSFCMLSIRFQPLFIVEESLVGLASHLLETQQHQIAWRVNEITSSGIDLRILRAIAGTREPKL